MCVRERGGWREKEGGGGGERGGERGGMRMASLSNRLCRFSSVCNCQCMCLFLCVCPVHVCVDVNM